MKTDDLEECKIKRLPPIVKDNEKLGQAIDRLENLTFSINMQGIPDRIHIEALRDSLPEIVKGLKAGFVEAFGENPWKE